MPRIATPGKLDSLHDLTRLIQEAEGFHPVVAALKNGHGATVDGAWGSSCALVAATLAEQASGEDGELRPQSAAERAKVLQAPPVIQPISRPAAPAVAQAPAVAGPEPSTYTRQLVAGLTNLDFTRGPVTKEQAEQWKQSLQTLTAQGAAGVPAIREFLQSICKNFKSVGLTEDSVFVAGNGAAVKWIGSGTSASGKEVRFEGIDVFEINQDGKIQNLWAYWHEGGANGSVGGLTVEGPGLTVLPSAPCTEYVLRFDREQILRAWRRQPCHGFGDGLVSNP